MNIDPFGLGIVPDSATIVGPYRYDLTRTWGDSAISGIVNFVMLNPSTADSFVDDPTIRRCVGFAQAWGYAGLVVTNLFAYRATKPIELVRVADPVGPENDRLIADWAGRSSDVVCAWGSNAVACAGNRVKTVMKIIRDAGRTPMVIRLTKGGHPGHPLYLPAGLVPVPFDPK